MSDSEDFDEIDCDHVLRGRVARVLMTRAATKDFLNLQSKEQARLLSNAKLWADGHRPNEEQFNGNEGRCGGENDRMLVAVKAFRIRLYGFIRRYRSVKSLLIVLIDPEKKQNKANPRSLKKARNLVKFLDEKCGDL